MTEKTEILEFADKTVDRAIEAACRHFNVDKEQLNIKLITRGSTGLFGLGGRKAKITASVKAGATAGKKDTPDKAVPTEASEQETVKPKEKPREPEEEKASESPYPPAESQEEQAEAAEEAGAESPVEPSGPAVIDASAYAPGDDEEHVEQGREDTSAPSAEYAPGEEAAAEYSAKTPAETVAEPVEEQVSEQEEEPEEISEEMLERLEKARIFTTQILDKAGLEAIVEINADASNPCLEISGEDISLIIGKDGHTLDAIEYIVNLNLKRSEEKGGKRIPVDAQGYRAKREDGLRRTAEKLAMKARKTRRSVAMSPMNSRERRIVHMAVKGINGVRTHSTGDGRLRKVIITPVKKGDGGRRNQGRRYNRRG